MTNTVIQPSAMPRLDVDPAEAPRTGGSFDRVQAVSCIGVIGVLIGAPWANGASAPPLWLAASAAVFLCAAAAVVGHQTSVQKTPVAFWIWLLVPAYAVFQSLIGGSINGAASALGSVRLLAYGALGACVWLLAQQRRYRRWIAWGLFGGVTVNALYGMFALHVLGDVAPWGLKTAYQGSLTGSFVNRNAYASFLALGVVLGVSLSMRGGRAVAWVGTAVLLIALMQTQSRLGIAAGIIGAGVVFGVRQRRLWIWCVLGPVALGAALAQRGVTIVADLELRRALYHQAWNLIAQRPFSGSGLDTFRAAFERVHASPLDVGLVWHTPHNGYLLAWSELGLVGGSLPILAVLAAVTRIWPVARIRRSRMSAAAIGATVVVGVHALGDVPLHTPANAMIFCAVLALALASAPRGGVTHIQPNTPGFRPLTEGHGQI